MAAPDSSPDPDDTDQEDMKTEIEANLLENVYIYLMEGRYQEGVSGNQKRVIRKKAANFRIVNGEMIFKKSVGERKGKTMDLVNFVSVLCTFPKILSS